MLSKEEMQQYWREKEESLNEKLVNRAVAYYEGGHPHYPARAFGLLFLMSASLNFENFEKQVLLPVKRPEFKKIQFRLPLCDINAYRVILPEKTTLQQFWKVFNKEPARIEVDFKFFGLSRTVVFTEITPLGQWEQCLHKAICED